MGRQVKEAPITTKNAREKLARLVEGARAAQEALG